MSRRKIGDHINKVETNVAYFRPNSFGRELDDHINVSLSSSNTIGRSLDPSSRSNLIYPVVGQFRSLMNMMYWLRSVNYDDQLRDCNRRTLNKLFLGLEKQHIHNFDAINLHALWLIVTRNEFLLNKIKALDPDLEILSYSLCPKSGLRTTNKYAKTIVPVIEELLSAIHNDRTPDYSRFITHKNSSIESGFIQPDILQVFKRNLDY